MRNIFIGIIAATLIAAASCTSSGGGSVTAPSPTGTTASAVGTKPTDAPCNGCSFSVTPQQAQLLLTWSGFAKNKNASCTLTTSPNSGSWILSSCEEGTKLVDYPIVPTVYTLTVNKNEGNDPPQMGNVDFHPPFGLFAGPNTAAPGHNGWMTVNFTGMSDETTHLVTATWYSNQPNDPGDDDRMVVYNGTATGTDNLMSVNVTSATTCDGAPGPAAVMSGSFTLVDANHISGTYNGSTCHPAGGTFTLTRQ